MNAPLTAALSEHHQDLVDQVLMALAVDRTHWDNLRQVSTASSRPWPGTQWEPARAVDLASYIDHTLLKPDATRQQIQSLCNEALEHNFAAICVNSGHVVECANLLAGSSIALCAVVGFPLGAMATPAKAAETAYCVQNCATEIDMVMSIGLLKQAYKALAEALPISVAPEKTVLSEVFRDIRSVVDAAGASSVKVILETGLLSDDEIVVASTVAILAGAQYIKTSTGFGHGGATVEAVTLMRSIAGPLLGVKASGGIRDTASAIKMIQAGANRLGTSSGVTIIADQAAS